MRRKKIYIDISDLYKAQGRTGIQRVIKEIVPRLIKDKQMDSFDVEVVNFKPDQHLYEAFSQEEVLSFLKEETVLMKPYKTLKISEIAKDEIFFDLDSAWNIPLKRPYLYSQLKSQGVYIITFIYDLIPIKFPHLAHENTLRNFVLFIAAVLQHSDLVMCDSRSAEKDLIELKDKLNIKRHLPTVVTHLGSDFSHDRQPQGQDLLPKALQNKKYLLFVGTIEPRKRHDLAIDAFTKISGNHKDVHLVFAGKQGWNSDKTIKKLESHPLYKKRIHWVDTPDDKTLIQLYANCNMALYLSNYEGFGLPVAEPLSFGKITVTSHNSSIPEVAGEYADYVYFNSISEIAETVSCYLNDNELYEARQASIESFSGFTWLSVYQTISQVLANLDMAKRIKTSIRPKKLQWVIISIDQENLAKTIKCIDKNVNFIKSYLIVTPKKLQKSMAAIKSDNPVEVITDEEVLGQRLGEFKRADHVKKNWMLRESLPTLDAVDPVFIMADDDNQPLQPIDLSYYVNEDGSHNAYYYYEAIDWPFYATSYDKGEQNMKGVLRAHNQEGLSYSSHMPQILSKQLFREVTSQFKTSPGDEWSAYFNYFASKYPTALNKKVFEVMNWPARPTDWQHLYRPQDYKFENYYSVLYENQKEIFYGLKPDVDAKKKIAIKQKQVAPFHRAIDLYNSSLPHIGNSDLGHGMVRFSFGDSRVYISGLPYLITTGSHAYLRIQISFKALNLGSNLDEIVLSYRAKGYSANQVVLRWSSKHKSNLVEGLASLPIVSKRPGVHNLRYSLSVNGQRIMPDKDYMSVMLVCSDSDRLPNAFNKL